MIIPKQPNAFCYNETAKRSRSQAIRKVYRAAAKQLPEFVFKTHFNPGGIAVYGETYAKIYCPDSSRRLPGLKDILNPVVEAYDTSMGLLVRQWDGRNSGANYYVDSLESFVNIVKVLAAKPFVRF